MNGELAHRADFAQYAEERTMRLLTINIHSHGSDFEPELYHQKMKALAAFMKEEEIDAAAIQECSEEEDRPVVSGPLPMHWVPAGPDSRVR